MKKIIKLLVLVAVVAIFAFSDNAVISKVRTFAVDNGKKVFNKENYDKVVEKGSDVVSQYEVKKKAQ